MGYGNDYGKTIRFEHFFRKNTKKKRNKIWRLQILFVPLQTEMVNALFSGGGVKPVDTALLCIFMRGGKSVADLETIAGKWFRVKGVHSNSGLK